MNKQVTLLLGLVLVVGFSVFAISFSDLGNVSQSSETKTEPIQEQTITKHYTINTIESGGGLGGTIHYVKKDIDGNVVLEGSTHNRVVDTGEEFLLDQVFQDATTNADNVQIAVICISDAGTITVAETETAADFDGDNGMTENNCKEDTAVTTTGGQAVIGALTFTCGGTNCANGDTITGIAICQARSGSDADFNDCATAGIMFSVIDISPDVTLNAGETVDITYTFDVITATS